MIFLYMQASGIYIYYMDAISGGDKKCIYEKFAIIKK